MKGGLWSYSFEMDSCSCSDSVPEIQNDFERETVVWSLVCLAGAHERWLELGNVGRSERR